MYPAGKPNAVQIKLASLLMGRYTSFGVSSATFVSSLPSGTAMAKLYLVQASIPEIDAQVGDVVIDCPVNGLCVVRRTGLSRSILALRSTSLLPLPEVSAQATPSFPRLAETLRSDRN